MGACCSGGKRSSAQTPSAPQSLNPKESNIDKDPGDDSRRKVAAALNLAYLDCPANSNEAQQSLVDEARKSLAREDPKEMPQQMREEGEKAVDQVVAAVLKLFPNNGKCVPLDGEELQELLDMFKIQDMKSSLNTKEYADVIAFVLEIARCVKLNPVLLAFGAEWRSLPADERNACFPLGAGRNEEVKRTVFYCFLLHAIATAVVFEPRLNADSRADGRQVLLEQLMTKFQGYRDTTEWGQYINLFEQMKVKTVDLPTASLMKYKRGEDLDDDAGGGWLLSVNILEAMYQDVKQGFDDNAQAGFELMLEPNDQKTIKGAGNGIDEDWGVKGDKLIPLRTPPLPRAWNNIYSSWNMAFVTAYKDSPPFLAKLLAPIVLGLYQDKDPGLYMMPRLICLYVHIQQQIVARVEAKGEIPFGDWRDNTASALWGRVNREAATSFQVRLEEIIDENYGVGTEIGRDLKRIAIKGLWGTLYAQIRAADATWDAVRAAASPLFFKETS